MKRRAFIKTVTALASGVVWLPKTLFGSTTKPKAAPAVLTKVNRRHVIDQIKADLELALQGFLFEIVNDDLLKKIRITICTKVMDKYVHMGLVDQYSLTNDSFENSAYMGTLVIQLTNTVEWTVLDFQVAPL